MYGQQRQQKQKPKPTELFPSAQHLLSSTSAEHRQMIETTPSKNEPFDKKHQVRRR